jgi:hypothetical protein
MTQTYNRYQESRDRYQESRDIWKDCNDRQVFEHDLINRKTTWSLTGQTILFAAYGVTLRSDIVDKGNFFRDVVAISGLLIAVFTIVSVRYIIRSKYLSFIQYKEFYCKNHLLPEPLNEKEHQWGVDTRNTKWTLGLEVSLPLIFALAWLCLFIQSLL